MILEDLHSSEIEIIHLCRRAFNIFEEILNVYKFSAMEKSLLETMKRLSSKNISDDLIKWNHLNEEDILCIEMIVHNEEYRKYLERLTSSKSSKIEKKSFSICSMINFN